MEGNVPQFDAVVGGSQVLPSACNLSEFLKSRMEEVFMLTEAMKESPFRGQCFQRLPKHMRRRQMSHHIKRLPRRLQRPYLMTLKDGPPAPLKRPSRKYRRRPGQLLTEYNRRQRENVWLETHIWHAKRFHMIKKWGYTLPNFSTSKSFRACYRAISQHCLITDISYYNCIELTGSEENILQKLKQCTSAECGLTFAAKMYLDGAREGSVTLFHPNSYPYNVIGHVTFMWKPFNATDTVRTIWIWVHPAIHNETVECFRTLFNLEELYSFADKMEVEEHGEEVKADPKQDSILKPKKRIKKNKGKNRKIEVIKLEPKNVPFKKTVKYVSSDNSVTMILLKDTLNKFRLTGPLSQAIISQAFHVIDVEGVPSSSCSDLASKKRKIDDVEDAHEAGRKMRRTSAESIEILSGKAEKKICWWEEYFKNGTRKNNWNEQKNFYQNLSKCSQPSDVSPGQVLSLVIGDPRMKIPSKRKKAVPEVKEPCQLQTDLNQVGLCDSPIWDPDVRDEVSLTKLTTYEINEARSRKIVPGSDVDDIVPNEKQSRIPILLVQRPGIRDHSHGRLGLGNGWDIISPAGFGMPIWLTLVFHGARPGGLRETESVRLETCSMKDAIQPDSTAGKTESESKFEELKSRHFRLPPNNRPNYIKLGVPSPFRCSWNLLLADWMRKKSNVEMEMDRFRVLRNVKRLGELNELVTKPGKSNDADLESLVRELGTDCLIPVSIECTGRGKPGDRALICLPKESDVNGSGESQPVVEPVRCDENEKSRKELKSEHAKLLKSLRRKRLKDRRKLKEDFANDLPGKLTWKDILKSNTAPSDEHSAEYKRRMESLWVPGAETIANFIDFPARTIIGFVTKGDFTFAKASASALGYVSTAGLVELVKLFRETKQMAKVLVRNTNQRQYRFGSLRIIAE